MGHATFNLHCTVRKHFEFVHQFFRHIADISLKTALHAYMTSAWVSYMVLDGKSGIVLSICLSQLIQITILSVCCPVLETNQTVYLKVWDIIPTQKRTMAWSVTQGVADWSTSRLTDAQLIIVQMLSSNLTVRMCQWMSCKASTYMYICRRGYPRRLRWLQSQSLLQWRNVCPGSQRTYMSMSRRVYRRILWNKRWWLRSESLSEWRNMHR